MTILKKAGLYLGGFLLGTMVFGCLTAMLMGYFIMGSRPFFNLLVLFQAETWLYGAIEMTLLALLYLLFDTNTAKRSKRMLKGKASQIEGALENSRFMTEKERHENFPKKKFKGLEAEKKDGIPVYAVYDNRKKDMDINICAPAHGLIIGATGSGKTTTFINPVIQILGHTKAGSSMICTDPKGELFQLHSKFLREHGYKVMVLDLRDPYSSFRWNPLGEIYDRYQLYLQAGEEIYERTDSATESGLTLVNAPEDYEDVWYEFEGKAYAKRRELIGIARLQKQKIFDELYEDLNDLISVICPIESDSDPVWEKGARSIIMATCLAMLEDSANPDLEMTKDKFCFYNISKAISNSENEFASLKDYFKGRSKLSKAVGLSRQVLSAADQTLSSYMSIAFDKMSMFNDEGLCALTAATDINPEQFASEPTALFLKIPDEKDTRHALAAVFILCIYKALIKVASGREDLSLPRNVYFLLDEFGNMPKIDKYDKMITVGRSRKLWFLMIVQSYAQLNNVYGDTVADIIKSNCAYKLFIGSNDIDTCKEFSELCGNTTISTTSVSTSSGSKAGEVSYSSQLQNRPLIYPSDLQKLNNAQTTGKMTNMIVVSFGNYPLKTQFTPSFRCPIYEFGQISLDDVRANTFFGDEIYYDLGVRNKALLDNNQPAAE